MTEVLLDNGQTLVIYGTEEFRHTEAQALVDAGEAILWSDR